MAIVLIGWNCSFDEIPIPDPPPFEYDKIPPIPEPDGPHPIDFLKSDSIIIEISTYALEDNIKARYYLIDSLTGEIDTIPKSISTDLEDSIYIRHTRHWLNLGSRLIGPGTSYAFTYTWREGTTISESESFTHTAGMTFTSGWSGFGFEASLELSYEFSSTFTSTKTISQEKEGSETQMVEAKEGVNRVYTVWQLMDVYDFVIFDEGKEDYVPIELETYKKNVITTIFGNFYDYYWDLVIIPDLPTLTNGTPSIAQSTFDFPI